MFFPRMMYSQKTEDMTAIKFGIETILERLDWLERLLQETPAEHRQSVFQAFT